MGSIVSLLDRTLTAPAPTTARASTASQPFGIGVNEDEADDVRGVRAGVKPDEEATQRVAGEDVESWDASGKEECVKVGDSIRGGVGRPI